VRQCRGSTGGPSVSTSRVLQPPILTVQLASFFGIGSQASAAISANFGGSLLQPRGSPLPFLCRSPRQCRVVLPVSLLENELAFIAIVLSIPSVRGGPLRHGPPHKNLRPLASQGDFGMPPSSIRNFFQPRPSTTVNRFRWPGGQYPTDRPRTLRF